MQNMNKYYSYCLAYPDGSTEHIDILATDRVSAKEKLLAFIAADSVKAVKIWLYDIV